MTFPNSNSSSRLSPVGQTRGKSKEWSYVVDGMSFSCREEGKMWLSEHKFTCPFQYNGKYDECQSCPKCRDKNMIKTLTSANYNDNFHDKEQLQLQMQEKKSKGIHIIYILIQILEEVERMRMLERNSSLSAPQKGMQKFVLSLSQPLQGWILVCTGKRRQCEIMHIRCTIGFFTFEKYN